MDTFLAMAALLFLCILYKLLAFGDFACTRHLISTDGGPEDKLKEGNLISYMMTQFDPNLLTLWVVTVFSSGLFDKFS